MTEARLVQTEEEAKQAQDFNQRAYNWIERHPLVTLVALVIACVGVVLFLVIVYWAFRPESSPEGAGFVYTVPIPGQELYRTGWDWLGLLIVPLVLAAGATIIGYVQKRTELDIAKKARKTEQQIATDRQMQTTLEAYYDRMTELMLEHGLRESPQDSEVRSIARARTVTVVKGLDGERNKQLFGFLKAGKLIDQSDPIISLRASDLSSSNLGEVDLFEVNLSVTNLNGSDLTNATLDSAVMTASTLVDATLTGANLMRAHLKGADLTNANLAGADLTYANLSNARLVYATLKRSHLFETNLSGANLSGANMSWAYMQRANLNSANLDGANLTKADLTGAELEEANLSRASLSDCHLYDANLCGAILKGTDLKGADLRGADLRGAIDWEVSQLDDAKSLVGTRMPNGVQIKEPGWQEDGLTYDEWKAQYLASRSPLEL